MKKILSLFTTIILFGNQGISQHIFPPDKMNGVSVSYSLTDFGAVSNHNILSNYIMTKGQHSLEFGPMFTMRQNYRRSGSNTIDLTGVNILYQYYPNRVKRKFDIFFEYHLMCQRIVDSWTSNFWNSELNMYEEIKLENIEILLQNYIGYGMKYSLLKNDRIQVRNNIGIGVYTSDVEENYEERLGVEYDFRSYGDFGVNWYIKLGFIVFP